MSDDDPLNMDGRLLQINRGFVNITGNVTGNGNGNVIVNIVQINNVEQFIYVRPPGDATGCKDKTTLTCGYGNGNNNNTTHVAGGTMSLTTSYDHMIRSSKRIGEAKISCSGCKKEFQVPATATTSFRCHDCSSKGVTNSVSGGYNYKKSVENKLLRQDQLDTNNGSSSSSLPKTTTGNKRAVLCIVTYNKTRYKLRRTINDVLIMKDLLLTKFQFPIHSIRVLTEEQKDPDLIPTKKNIMESLQWLVRDCKLGDSLVFYFFGHGLQQPAHPSEDEMDGPNATICPVDFVEEELITDYEINCTIVRPLKIGVKLHAIIDACQSGSTLDLVHVYKNHNGNWKRVDNEPVSKNPIYKGTSGGAAICLSACEDSQMAADTSVFERKYQIGAMTYLLAKTIRENSGITYADLLQKMHNEIGMNQQRKYRDRLLRRLFDPKMEQMPSQSQSLCSRTDIINTMSRLR